MKYARQRLHGIVVEIGYANTYEAQARSWAQGQPGIYLYIYILSSGPAWELKTEQIDLGSKVFLNTNEMT